jgi:hypothetical protein
LACQQITQRTPRTRKWQCLHRTRKPAIGLANDQRSSYVLPQVKRLHLKIRGLLRGSTELMQLHCLAEPEALRHSLIKTLSIDRGFSLIFESSTCRSDAWSTGVGRLIPALAAVTAAYPPYLPEDKLLFILEKFFFGTFCFSPSFFSGRKINRKKPESYPTA